MYYHIVPGLKLIYAWSPKCACTTVKTAVLKALGFQTSGNVHNDMLSNENLSAGKYGIYRLSPYRRSVNINLRDYQKVCVIRNPYSRYISSIRQRASALCEHEEFRSMTAADYLLYMEKNDFGEDHHFHPQTRHLKKFSFDRVLDISEMNVFFEMLNLEYNGERFGHHATHYDRAANSLHSSSLFDLTRRIQFPKGLGAWLDAEGITKLRALYAGDFDFAGSHGHNYELPQE